MMSKKPRKQRRAQMEAPAHKMRAFLGAHLSKDLRAKHKTRSIPLRKGDTVKIMRGQFKSLTGIKKDRENRK